MATAYMGRVARFYDMVHAGYDFAVSRDYLLLTTGRSGFQSEFAAARRRLPAKRRRRRWLCGRPWRWIIEWWFGAGRFVSGGVGQAFR
ncbi:MAG: hypothetical protein ABSG86_11880 [Thermoguttaceae bacterium]|jgi:hypothetical protein